MTKKDRLSQQKKKEVKKQSDMLKEQSAKEINRKFRDGALLDKKK